VFHVFQLKKKLGKVVSVQNQIPIDFVEQMREPELILERRTVNRRDKVVTEVLVKWKFLPIEEASWEE